MAPLLVFESHRASDQIKRLRTLVHPLDPASECSQLENRKGGPKSDIKLLEGVLECNTQVGQAVLCRLLAGVAEKRLNHFQQAARPARQK